jgi:small-conductance mechanosensitive channel
MMTAARHPRLLSASTIAMGLFAIAGGNVIARPLTAQAPLAAPAPREAVPVAQRDTAALVVQNRVITIFRTPLGAASPRERADAAARRIRALIEAETTDSVEARPIAEGVLVTVGGRGVFTLTPADADTITGERLAPVTARAIANLRTAIASQREERSLPHLLRAAGLALLATVLFVVLLRAIRWSRRRLTDRLLALTAARLPDLNVRGFTIFSGDTALALVRRLVDVLAWGTGLFAAYLWLAFVLTRFAYTRPWGEALGGYLRTTIGALALSAVSAIPGLFTVVIVLVATRWLVRLVSTFFDAVQGGTVEVPWPHPETANATKRIATVLLWLFAIVVAYPYVPGSGSDVFKGVSVFAGLVISLGSSGIVNQAMSGLVLMYSRAFKPGDYVRVGEVEGTVTMLGMLSTKVRTTKREEITLPNAVIVGASVKNYSRTAAEPGLLVYTGVTIGYDTPWRQVEALLLLAAERSDGLRREPPPFVLKPALSDFFIEYQLNAVLEAPDQRVRVLDRLHANILDCFNEYGVQITSPHYESDPPRPAIVPRERWHAAPADRAPPASSAEPAPAVRAEAGAPPG